MVRQRVHEATLSSTKDKTLLRMGQKRLREAKLSCKTNTAKNGWEEGVQGHALLL